MSTRRAASPACCPNGSPSPRPFEPRTAPIRSLALALTLATAGAALGQTPAPQSSPPDSSSGPSAVVHPSGAFKFTPPSHWRQLTISEARLLQQTRPGEFPADLVDWRNLVPEYMPYGNVPAWLENGFDGACMVTYMLEGEVSLEEAEESREQILSGAAAATKQEGVLHEILGLEPAELPSGQKGYVARSRLRFGVGKPVYRALEYYLPTAGSTLLLVMRSREGEFEEREAELRSVAESVVLARAPRGRSGLGGRLLEALLLGSLVGVILVMIYQRKRDTGQE